MLSKVSVRLKVTAAALMMVLAAAFNSTVSTGTAHASGCHVFWNQPSFQGDYAYYSQTYTVPSWSSCHDIQISNIAITSGVGTRPNCIDVVWIQYFPSSGGIVDGPVHNNVCSSSASSWVVLGTNVLDGTRYRIAYSGVVRTQQYAFEIMD